MSSRVVRRCSKSLALRVAASSAAFAASAAAANSAAHEAQPIASYRIVATLNPEAHEISATATIRWQNPSRTPTSELFLHAYLNAFAHPSTRFLRVGTARTRSALALRSPGSLTISRLVAREFGDADLLGGIAVHSPGDPDDATDLKVSLPEEVAPGETLTLDVDFRAKLPNLVERAGFAGTFHAVAQWFPKLAFRDTAGEWHHFAYEPVAEFSSNFGDYDITLDVPAHYVVAAPGVASLEPADDKRRRERYRLKSVHDFAWFAWDGFAVATTRQGPVELRYYASKDQSRNAPDTLELLAWGLEFFGERYSPYPYASFTIVHPPDRARAASGMEYPQLVTTGGPWYFPRVGLRVNEAVALHELAHQWFYGTVATNEFRYPVLDEGLTSWAESEALSARYGAGSFLELSVIRISEAVLRREYARKYTRRGPLGIAASDFGDFASLSGRIYARFPTLLETIQRSFGREPLEAALRNYATSFRFAHPTPDDFLDSVRSHLPARAVAALSTALFADGWVDFAVTDIQIQPTAHRDRYANRILIERRGTLDFPLMLEVGFADGHVARRYLETVAPSSWVEWPHTSPIVVVTLDPEHRITIDDDLENHTLRVAQRSPRGRLEAALHLLVSALLSLGWP